MTGAELRAILLRTWTPHLGLARAKERSANVAMGLAECRSWPEVEEYLLVALRLLEREDYVRDYGPAPALLFLLDARVDAIWELAVAGFVPTPPEP